MNDNWWIVKVYCAKSETYTTLSKFGELVAIIDELAADGYWQFVSARLEENGQFDQ